MKTFLFAFILSFGSLLSCQHQERTIAQRVIELESIPEKDFDRLVEDIRCIPLKKSSTYFMDCWKLILYKDYIYIYSLSDFSVFIYDNNGNFVRQIDNRGKGKIETPTDIIINTNQDELWICDSRTKINKYHLDGTFIESIQTPTTSIKLAFERGKSILAYEGLFNRNSNQLFSSYTDNWKLKETFIEKGKMKNVGTAYPPSVFTQDSQNSTTYALLFHKSTIYKYENERLTPFIRLDFNGQAITEDKYPEGGFSDVQFSDLITKTKQVYSIQNFQFVSNKLLFKTIAHENNMYYLIDCKNNADCKFDSLFDGFKPEMINPIGGNGDKYLYLLQKKEALVDYYKDKKCNYKEINDIISSDETLDGVVICIQLK